MREKMAFIVSRQFAAMVMAFILLFPGRAGAYSFVDDNGIRWTVGERNEAYEILYADDSFLYLTVDSEIKRLNRNFDSGLESLTDQEEKIVRQKSETETGMTKIPPSQLKVEGNTLFYGRQPILDVTPYLENNRLFYQDHPDLEAYPVDWQVSSHLSASGLELLLVTSCPAPSVPAPYTDYYCDLIALREGQAIHLTALEKFSPQQVLESQDGTLWLTGSQHMAKFLYERSLFRIDSQGNLHSVNQFLRCNDIRLLQAKGNQVTVWAGTHAFFFEPDPGKYDQLKDLIYCISSAGAVQTRPEEVGEMRSMCCTPGGEIFGISADGRSVVNLTAKQFFPMPEQDEYKRIEEMIQAHMEEEASAPTAPARRDQDGSRWLVESGQVVHDQNGNKEIFYGGQETLLNGMYNLFIDAQNNKWFLSVAGIGFLPKGAPQVQNLNPVLPASYPGADKQRMFVDDQGSIWRFGPQIDKLTRPDSTPVTAADPQAEGFIALEQDYIEYQDKVYFAYQKSHANQSVTLRIFSLDRSGQLYFRDYPLSKPGMYFFACDQAFYVSLSDGFWRLEDGWILEAYHPCLKEITWSYCCLDPRRLAFATQDRTVLVEIPRYSNAADSL